MAFTNFSIVCDAGGNQAPVTVVIPIPSKGTLTSDATGQLGSIAAVASLALDVARVGFWDALQQNFYPAAAIRKITPQ